MGVSIFKTHKNEGYHGHGERVDVFDVPEAALPGDQALDVDVELVPDSQDCIVILLIPV